MAGLTQYRTQLAPLATLEGILPVLLRHLSLGRAQIAIDHIRGAIDAKMSNRIVLLTLCHADDLKTPLAAAIAIQQSDPATESACDMASIVHAGLMDDAVDPSLSQNENAAGEVTATQNAAAQNVVQASIIGVGIVVQLRFSTALDWLRSLRTGDERETDLGAEPENPSTQGGSS